MLTRDHGKKPNLSFKLHFLISSAGKSLGRMLHRILPCQEVTVMCGHQGKLGKDLQVQLGLSWE